MNTKIFSIALAGALIGSGATEAQWIGPGWNINIELTAQDREMIRSTVQREIHEKRPDTVAAWSNPTSGHSGTITLLGKFVRQGMPCEQIEYRIMTSRATERPERYVFNSCRLPDGSWKLAG